MSRDQKEICLYCKWWHFDPSETQLRWEGPEPKAHYTGLCRRHAPVRRGGEVLKQYGAWPMTNGGAWCGDFQERPDDHDSWQSIGDAATAVISQLNVENDDAA